MCVLCVLSVYVSVCVSVCVNLSDWQYLCLFLTASISQKPISAHISLGMVDDEISMWHIRQMLVIDYTSICGSKSLHLPRSFNYMMKASTIPTTIMIRLTLQLIQFSKWNTPGGIITHVACSEREISLQNVGICRHWCVTWNRAADRHCYNVGFSSCWPTSGLTEVNTSLYWLQVSLEPVYIVST